MKFRLILVSFVFALLIVPAFGQEAAVADECVTDYEAGVDYFPDKAELDYAEGFEIEYFDNYKVIRVPQPWSGAGEEDLFEYVLVQCGTPAPDPAEFSETAQFIEVPASDIISMSTTYLPHLDQLDLVDQLVGMDSLLYANTPSVVEKIESGEVTEVGSGSTVNVEAILDLDPSIIMTYGSGFPEFDAHPTLLDAGLFVAMNADFVESTLLGRAEWLKFTAAFYNLEAEAETLFDAIVDDYDTAQALVEELPEDERITVLWNSFSSFSDSWPIPGQETWVGDLLHDAGVDYVLQDDAPGDISLQADFETVYDAGLETPVWVINLFGINTKDDLLAADERFADFAAFENGNVYNSNKGENANGGNDYYETGVSQPNLVLKDLIAMFYPDLLPDYETMFFKKLDGAE